MTSGIGEGELHRLSSIHELEMDETTPKMRDCGTETRPKQGDHIPKIKGF